MKRNSVRSLLRMSCLVSGLAALVLLPAPVLGNPQPVTGACCDVCHECQVLMEYECLQQGSVYYGDFTTCEPNPCSGPPTTPGACCYPDGTCIAMECDWPCFIQGGSFRPRMLALPTPVPSRPGRAATSTDFARS